MKKTISILLLTVILFTGVLSVSPLAHAGTVSGVIDSWVDIDFPLRITFNISAQSEKIIEDIRLHYRINRMAHARITSEVYIAFSPSTSVSESWNWDMRTTGGLPPGSSIVYWWTVTDELGNVTVTETTTVNINDERYTWESLSERNVTIYWYSGGEDFSGELMAATQDSVTKLYEETGAELENPVSIYIYANSADLRGSMVFPQEWTGGVAFTRYGIIAIGIGDNPSDMAWGKRAIAHELTHLIIHQVTFNPYSDIPTWLSEGLAVNAEGPLQMHFANMLQEAYENDSFISVRSLASPFSTETNKSLLSYAQSSELVRYLVNEYGQEKMFELLNTFKQGSGYDKALLKVYGFDMDELGTLWKAAFIPVSVG